MPNVSGDRAAGGGRKVQPELALFMHNYDNPKLKIPPPTTRLLVSLVYKIYRQATVHQCSVCNDDIERYEN